MQVNERRPHLPRVSPTLLASSVILALSCLSLPLIRIQAFVPSSTRSSGSCGYSYSSSTSQCNIATSTRLLYAMPDVQSMKATEMKEELQSYGINTNTLFDKHDFEHALQEARRLYEQTLDDVMASTRPKEKTKKKTTTTGFDAQQSQSQSSQSQQRKAKTVNYDRARHQDERIFTTDVNAQQNQHQHEPQFETAFGGNQHYQNHHQQQERQHQQQHHRHSQQQQQERPRPRQRQQRHYQASPDQVGPNFHEYNTANNHNNANNNWDGRRRPQRPPRQAFEVDPMYAHEAQHQHHGGGGGGFYGDSHEYGQQHHQEYHHEQRQYEDSYEVGGQQQHQHQQHQPRSYVDPEVNMKYQAALMEAYNMKVEDLQRELNTRGVSTKYCMVFKDFCHEYAEAIADNKQKKVVIKVTRSSDVDDDEDDDEDDDDDDEDDDESSTFGDDEDYDPSYRDVVMQKYDPSMWI